MLLGKAEILAAKDLVYEDVAVPEWGGSVRVVGLAAEDLDLFEQSRLEQRGGKLKLNLANTRAKLCAKCIVDENLTRIFSTADIAELSKKSGRALDRVYSVAARLSGVKEDEEAEKNSVNGSV